MQGVDYSTLNVTLGTRLFMAPELVNSKEPHDTAVDIWALGITAYYILTYGEYPFSGITREIVNNKILFHEPDLSKLDNLEPPAKDFIQKCLDKERWRRPSAETLLQHEWIVGMSSEPICQKSSIMATVDELNHYSEMHEF